MSRHSQHREGAGRRRDPATTRRGIGGGRLRLEGARPFVATRAGGGGGIFQTRDASAAGGGGALAAGAALRTPRRPLCSQEPCRVAGLWQRGAPARWASASGRRPLSGRASPGRRPDSGWCPPFPK